MLKQWQQIWLSYYNLMQSKQKQDVMDFWGTLEVQSTPSLVKIELLVHAKTRKRSHVEKLAAEGLSISYQKVQDLQKRLLLNTAIDNIIYDASSKKAKYSFHGTSIYFIQHPKSEVTDPNHFKLKKELYWYHAVD